MSSRLLNLVEPRSTSIRTVDLVDGTAKHIEEPIKPYMYDSKLMGFASDGASVMTGRLTRVVTRLH